MKRRPLILAMAAVVLAISGLVWHAQNQRSVKPVAVTSKAELTRLANMERQKKDGIIAPPKKAGSVRTIEEQTATRQAMPSRDTSLTSLDLSRPPTEAELIKAGQLRAPLSPTASADTAKISDPVAKARQEQDNLLFGQAVNAWNQNQRTEAMRLFLQHLKTYPDSPWAAETRLHLGMASLLQSQFAGCHGLADLILKTTIKGSDVYQKALMLKARTLVLEGRTDEAAKAYGDTITTETDARRKSMAASWLQALSQQRKKQS